MMWTLPALVRVALFKKSHRKIEYTCVHVKTYMWQLYQITVIEASNLFTYKAAAQFIDEVETMLWDIS